MTTLAIVLAAIGACAYAVGARLQNHAVRGLAPETGLGPRGLWRVIRANRWLLGLTAIGVGAVLHAIALGLAPLIVVQPVGVLALPLTALLNVRAEQLRLNRSAVFAIAASGLGVAAFVWLTASTAITTDVPPGVQVRATELVVAAVAVLTLAATFASGRARCLLFAAGCGACYGFVSFLMHGVTLHLRTEGLGGVRLLPVLGIVLALLAGAWLLQLAHASGPPDLVVACLTVVDPILAVGIGIGLLGEAALANPLSIGGQILCGLLAIVGVIGLAHFHPERHGKPERRGHPERPGRPGRQASGEHGHSSEHDDFGEHGHPYSGVPRQNGRRDARPLIDVPGAPGTSGNSTERGSGAPAARPDPVATEASDDLVRTQQPATAASRHRRGDLSP